MRKYRCVKCKGSVTSNHQSNGLGTWHCDKGCSNPCKVEVILTKEQK